MVRKLFAILFALGMLTVDAHAAEGKSDGAESGSLRAALMRPIYRLEAGIFAGAFIPSGQHELFDPNLVDQYSKLSAGADIGLRLAFLPTAMVGVEGEVAVVPTSTEAGDGALVTDFRAHLLIQYPWTVTPFVVLGGGSLGISSDEAALGSDRDKSAHLGIGAKYPVHQQIDLRLDLRQIYTHRKESFGTTVHTEALLGAAFRYDLVSAPAPAPAPKPKPEVVPAPPPEPKDSDGDGITDDADACRSEPEDVDGFQDDDGCPDLDNDGDGIPDINDQCANEAEVVNGISDEDGCPDAVTDKDGDGIDDVDDSCPTEAEDADGHEDDDGCPDPDNDGNGIPDVADECPLVAGVPDQNGCPDPDGDGDGVPDRFDNCPQEAGDPKLGGCKVKQLVRLTGDKVEILEKVLFQTGKAVITEGSFTLLKNVAQVITAHPEIAKIVIEGHTDDRGSDKNNLKLSDQRAKSVRDFLIKEGIAPERLEAVGFGESKPIAPNATRRGRAANRRVEFQITDRK